MIVPLISAVFASLIVGIIRIHVWVCRGWKFEFQLFILLEIAAHFQSYPDIIFFSVLSIFLLFLFQYVWSILPLQRFSFCHPKTNSNWIVVSWIIHRLKALQRLPSYLRIVQVKSDLKGVSGKPNHICNSSIFKFQPQDNDEIHVIHHWGCWCVVSTQDVKWTCCLSSFSKWLSGLANPIHIQTVNYEPLSIFLGQELKKCYLVSVAPDGLVEVVNRFNWGRCDVYWHLTLQKGKFENIICCYQLN